MFYKPTNKKNILEVDDNFATLKNVTDDGETLQFEFKYSISKKEAIRNNSYYVEISVSSEEIKNQDLTNNFMISDPVKMVNNILTSVIDTKNFKDKNAQAEFASIKSDISATIDNQQIENYKYAIRSGDDSKIPVRSQLKAVPAKTLKQNNSDQLIFDQLNFSRPVENINHKKTSIDLLFKKGIDPSSVKFDESNFINSYNSLQGISVASKGISNAAEEIKFLNDSVIDKLNSNSRNNISSAFQLKDEEYVTIKSEIKDDITQIPAIISFPITKTKNCTVHFRLINGASNKVVDYVNKNINVYRHIDKFFVPYKSPSVNITKPTLGSRNVLEIKQNDPVANHVFIYKKNINNSLREFESFFFIDKIFLKYNDSIKYEINQDNVVDNQIYRVVAARDNVLGPTFSGCAIKSQIPSKAKFVSLSSTNLIDGVQVFIKDFPHDVISFNILRRNLSLYETNFSIVENGDNISIDPKNNSIMKIKSYTYKDTQVNDSHIYEYAVSLQYHGGSKVISGSEIIEYIAEKPGQVDIIAGEPTIITDNIFDVSFKVDIVVKDEDIDAIKKILQQQGFESYFEGEIKNQRGQIKKILAYSVERIYLETGEREYLGIHTDSQFVDSSSRKKSNANYLKTGSYRYVIKALMRNPETVLENYRVSVTDPITKKKYTKTPYTTNHPIALKKGTIVTHNTIKYNYSKNVFEHGEIGCTTIVDVTIPKAKSRIKSVSASRFDDEKIVVLFEIDGDINQFDHFIISKKNGNMSTVVNKIHSSFSRSIIEYMHKIGNEVGSLYFSVTPVYVDYQQGDVVTSNFVLVES